MSFPPFYDRDRHCCPRCGEPFEDDGDRRYDDECFECGWQTPYRRRRNEENARMFAAIRNRTTEEE